MDESQIDFRVLFGVLRRQLKLIAVTVVACLAIALAVLFTITPIFTSTALVLYQPGSKNLLEAETQLGSNSVDSGQIESEVELLRSDNILLRVVAAENLVADSEFRPRLGWRARLMAMLRLVDASPPTGQQALNETLTHLRSAFAVQRRGLTHLISVQARSRDPEKAARIANALATAYIEDQLQAKVDSQLALRDILQARVTQASAEIVASENALDDFLDTNLDRISADAGRSDFGQIRAQIEHLQSERDRSANLLASTQQSLEQGDLESIVAQLQSDALVRLDTERQNLIRRLGEVPDSPAAADLRAQLATIEEDLRTAATTAVNDLQGAVSTSQTREAELRTSLRQQILSSSLSADILTALYGLQQRAEIARAEYQTLLSRTQNLATQASLQVADSRIASAALPPSAASYPDTPTALALTFMAALALGIALAFLYENLIGGFMSEEQTGAVLRIPVAAALPRERMKSDQNSLSGLMISDPLSVYAEAVRRMRAAIDQRLRRRPAQDDARRAMVVMVTSTTLGEGKTTVALSLARSYAFSGKRTLLIDGDLRKPSVYPQLGIETSHGLIDLLSGQIGQSEVGSLMVDLDEGNLTIIAGTRRSDLPTDQLLTGTAFQRLLDAARMTFDIVIVDTPPIGQVVDGLYMAPFANIILFVTRWASTAQRDAKLALSSLTGAADPGTPILAVLNQQDEARNGYRRRYGAYPPLRK